MKKSKNYFLGIAISLAVFSAFAFSNNNYFEITKNLDIFTSIFKELNTYYVDELDNEALVETGLNAMVGSLDPYTVFISEDELEGFKMQTTGKYGGVGAVIRKVDGKIFITEPYEGFPAHKAGLIAGDQILSIDGESIKGFGTSEVSELLRGVPNTEVNVTIFRPSENQEVDITLLREEINVGAVTYSGIVDDQVAYIGLRSFTENCSDEMKLALEDLKKTGPLKGLILDLRGNPGGLLHEAVKVSNLFIDKNKLIVSTKGKLEEWSRDHKTKAEPFDSKIPLVVLINGNSASAAEIVAGVIQDYDRGLIVGSTTFGKGLVQVTTDLSYNSSIKITTAKYYIPSGRCIQSASYDSEGNRKEIADSMKSEFKTMGGRPVLDGGGVSPDIKVKSESLADITYGLISKQKIFQYVNNYVQSNPKVENAQTFSLSDEEYNDFMSYINDSDFEYKVEKEYLLDRIERQMADEKLKETVQPSLDKLRAIVKSNKESDLMKHKSQIKMYLEEEIVIRSLYQKGGLASSFDEDESIKEALSLLKNQVEYKRHLK